MLILEKLSKSFKGTKRTGNISLFRDFNLKLVDGDFFALCGPSGSGKTTLMLMAGGLLSPDDGTVYIYGRDIYSMSTDSRAEFMAEHIGFLFQQFHLMPYLSVKDNILLPELALKKDNAESRAEELIEELKLSERAAHRPSELSIGERQRTALARAMIHSPKLLLVDEPTGNLDHKNADIVLDMLRKFTDQGNCVLMVTHSKEAAERADKTIFL